MGELFAALENTAFSTWLRESATIWAYPTVLTLHTVGLALLVGANWVFDLRVLGAAPAVPLASITGLFRVMWIGFWINAISGALLFAADATTKGSTWLFLGKMALVVIGVAAIPFTRHAVYDTSGSRPAVRASQPSATAKTWAVTSIVVWLAAITAGRLMAYL